MRQEFFRMIPTNPIEIKKTAMEAVDFIASSTHCADDIHRIRLCVLEAMANSYNHGNQRNEEKKITVSIILYANMVEITIRDEGTGIRQDLCFDFPEWQEESGRGMPILMAYCDDIVWQNDNGEIKMIFNITS